MHEFDIIKKFFATETKHRRDVICGIGDDAALVNVPTDHELAITTDTLVSGIHFLTDANPFDIGYKSLAVNLSDLAAMGATPAWVTLALTLPDANEAWLQDFCRGFFTLANHYHIELIGGDLTQGPLAITITAFGFVPRHEALLRSQAKPHDLIYVTGTLGDAGLALQCLEDKPSLEKSHNEAVFKRLNHPEPRIAIGVALRRLASAAIDISDGLAADLGHILEESKVGARINVNQLPLSDAMHSLSLDDAIALALTSGDDYELCFTLPPQKRSTLEKKLSALSCRYTCIGEIVSEPNLTLHYQNGTPYHGPTVGYKHF